MNEVININNELLKKFILEVQNKYPIKSFGYFICSLEKNDPEDYIMMKNDMRENMKKEFEEYGEYYIRNKDAGFLSTEMETIEIHKKLLKEKKKIIGVFHSHQRHPSIFSNVDLELHPSDHIWHLVISLRNLILPQIKIFKINNKNNIKELKISINKNIIEKNIKILKSKNIEKVKKTIIEILDRDNVETNIGELQYFAYIRAKKISEEFLTFAMYKSYYKDSEKNYKKYIEKHMLKINGGKFYIGASLTKENCYLNEKILKLRKIKEFKISNILITNELYSKYDINYEMNQKKQPVVNVTWYDCFMFAIWCNCRLPTEIEWEYACSKKENTQWAVKENELINYGWYSENSNGKIQNVMQLKANKFGLYDMHGNVWEWCQDKYSSGDKTPNRINKGGSFNAFSEMCRTSFRNNEPENFFSYDLGFRVARGDK